MSYYIAVLKKYADFSGRARRKEYWMFVLFNILFSFVAGFIDGFFGTMSRNATLGIFGTVYTLLLLVPSLAVTARRLHDTGRSGWWILIALVPLLGAIVLLVFNVSDSDPGTNKYGPNPKAESA